MFSIRARRNGEAMPSGRGFDFTASLRAARFAIVDLSAFLFRCAEGPALYFRCEKSRPAFRANRCVRMRRLCWESVDPDHRIHGRGNLEHFPRAAGDLERAHLALFPCCRRYRRLLDARERRTGEAACGANGSCAPLRLRVTRKRFGRARSAGLLSAGSDLTPLLEQYKSWLLVFISCRRSNLESFVRGWAKIRAALRAECHGASRDGTKCERCWNYSTHVGENADYPTVRRCGIALDETRASSGLRAGGRVR